MRNIESDRGVSPVVGVMLMLVVTIIIAAVVSAFAGGMAEGTDATPQATVAFTYNLADNVTYFENKGGDSVVLSDLKIRFKSGTTSTTISPSDVGETCYAFEITDGSTVFAPGSRILLAGTGHDWAGTGIAFGSATIGKNDKIEWEILSADTGNAIASGSEVLT